MREGDRIVLLGHSLGRLNDYPLCIQSLNLLLDRLLLDSPLDLLLNLFGPSSFLLGNQVFSLISSFWYECLFAWLVMLSKRLISCSWLLHLWEGLLLDCSLLVVWFLRLVLYIMLILLCFGYRFGWLTFCSFGLLFVFLLVLFLLLMKHSLLIIMLLDYDILLDLVVMLICPLMLVILFLVLWAWILRLLLLDLVDFLMIILVLI